MPSILVCGIVAFRTKEPRINLEVDDRQVQLSLPEARQVAHDLLAMCARTEADAMLVQFFGKQEFPDGATVALLEEFRDFRARIDAQRAERPEHAE